MLGMLALAGLVCGCSRYAAVSNRIYPEDADETPRQVLSDAQQRRLKQAMAQVADDRSSSSRDLGPAPLGMRWSDVPNAVYAAVMEVEMAIVWQTHHDWGWEYRLLTVEDYPGTLTVKRTNDGRVYQASATIGRFVDQPARAQALLAELHKQMLAFGRKRSLAGE